MWPSSGAHRRRLPPLFELLAYTGLRIGEALGLRRCDMDLEMGVLRARQQLSRYRELKHLKTDSSRWEMVLAPAVTRLMREPWLASPTQGQAPACVLQGQRGGKRLPRCGQGVSCRRQEGGR